MLLVVVAVVVDTAVEGLGIGVVLKSVQKS